MPEPYRELFLDIYSLLTQATPTANREQLRHIANRINRLSSQICLRIDQEVIRELQDQRRAMPEHGFRGERRLEPSTFRALTDDEL